MRNFLSVAGAALAASLVVTAASAEVRGTKFIDVDRVNLQVFALGFALAALAGVLVSMSEQVSPFIGFPFTISAFVIVILGGLVTSTLLNLFLVPTLYLRFGRTHSNAAV